MTRSALRLAVLLSLVLSISSNLVAYGTPVAVASALEWEPCAMPELPTRECATMLVPLDYDEPDGETIAVAVARAPATDPDNRVGSLILNPGGPGGPGVAALALMYAALPEPLPARFDVVSFDPRGIGESTPVRCFDSIDEQTAFFNAYPTVPIGAGQVTAREEMSADLARQCGERNGERLAHLSTANVARDMDQVRQAVGDEHLTYLGASYGTYLGATYANLFPDRIRAMVLDGVIDPPSYANADHGVSNVLGAETNAMLRITSDQGTALAFDEFLDRCVAAGPDRCSFAGGSVDETQARFDALMQRVLDAPMTISGSAGTLTVTYSVVVESVRGALYTATEWTNLADALTALEAGDALGFLEATHNVGAPQAETYQNSREGLFGSNCVDADQPREIEAFQVMTEAAGERTPYFGAAWAYLLEPCTTWPAVDDDRYTGPWDNQTSETILLISRVFDPATPHASAQAAATSLADAQLLTIDGWGHSYFEGGLSSCANAYMAAYLLNQTLPPADTVCAEDVPPFS